MPRTHLAILALGVLLILIAGIGEDRARSTPARVTATSDADLGEPDLFMETAEISQFGSSGELAYRIRAINIVHYPDDDHTLLSAPRLTLYRADEPPWEISAERGRIIGGTGLLDAGALSSQGDRAEPGRETVHLSDDVVIQRQRPGEGFIELRTSYLTLLPGREYAETQRPVIIDTESGRTTAEGLRANLAAGTIFLGAPGLASPDLESPDLATRASRVRTTIFPGTLR